MAGDSDSGARQRTHSRESKSRVNLACPACDHVLTRWEVGRMYPFWREVQARPCGGCGRRLRWRLSLHRSLRIGAWVFRTGAIVVVTSLIAAVVLHDPWGVFPFIACIGAWIAFFGGMIAAPKGQERWFELDDGDVSPSARKAE